MNGWNAIIGLLLLAGLASCESSSGPDTGLNGTWVLRSVAGDPLPSLLHADDAPFLVLSDTLEFAVIDADYSRPVAVSTRRVGAPGSVPLQNRSHYLYERAGDDVTLQLTCRAGELCVLDQRHGVIDGATLTLEYVPTNPGHPFRSPLVYQRVR